MSFQTSVLLPVHNFRGFASRCGTKCSAKRYLTPHITRAQIYGMAAHKRSGRGLRLDLVLRRVEMIEMSYAVVEAASRLTDPVLRSLEAVHLATALLVREDVEAVLTYLGSSGDHLVIESWHAGRGYLRRTRV